MGRGGVGRIEPRYGRVRVVGKVSALIQPESPSSRFSCLVLPRTESDRGGSLVYRARPTPHHPTDIEKPLHSGIGRASASASPTQRGSSHPLEISHDFP